MSWTGTIPRGSNSPYSWHTPLSLLSATDTSCKLRLSAPGCRSHGVQKVAGAVEAKGVALASGSSIQARTVLTPTSWVW